MKTLGSYARLVLLGSVFSSTWDATPSPKFASPPSLQPSEICKKKNTPQLVANLSPSWRFCSSAVSLCGRTPSRSSQASSLPVVTAAADWHGRCCIPRKYRENLAKFSCSVLTWIHSHNFYLSCIFFPLTTKGYTLENDTICFSDSEYKNSSLVKKQSHASLSTAAHSLGFLWIWCLNDLPSRGAADKMNHGCRIPLLPTKWSLQ